MASVTFPFHSSPNQPKEVSLQNSKSIRTSNENGECSGDGDEDMADRGDAGENSEWGGVMAPTAPTLSVQVSKSLTVCFSAAIFKAKFSCLNLEFTFCRKRI